MVIVNLHGVIEPAQSPVIKYAIVPCNFTSLPLQKLLSHPLLIIFTFFYSMVKIKNLKVTFFIFQSQLLNTIRYCT